MSVHICTFSCCDGDRTIDVFSSLAAALHAIGASLQRSIGVGPRPLRKFVFAARAPLLRPRETARLVVPRGIMMAPYSMDHKVTTASIVNIVAVRRRLTPPLKLGLGLRVVLVVEYGYRSTSSCYKGRTLGVSCWEWRERGTSGRYAPSAPRPCSAGFASPCGTQPATCLGEESPSPRVRRYPLGGGCVRPPAVTQGFC
jgi:hypothetical protein